MKALVLGGGSDHLALISRLKERGAYVVLVDYYENPPAKAVADRHHVVSTLDQEGVLAVASGEKCDVVLTCCVDQATLTAAWVSEGLGLPFYLSHQTALQVSNKAHMKAVFARAGIPTPRSLVVGPQTNVDPDVPTYPAVVKPADANGSFGITRVDTPATLASAIEHARRSSRTGTAVVDEYLAGDEISVDAFVHDGEVSVLLATRSIKLAAVRDCFPIYRSEYPVPLDAAELEQIRTVAAAIPKAFGIRACPLVIQMIRSPRGLRVIEFGARIAGGSKHHLIRRVTGADVIDGFVRLALDGRASVTGTPAPICAATTYIYSLPGVFRELRGGDALLRDGTIDSVHLYKTPGMSVESHRASRDRIGSFITVGSDPADLTCRLSEADARLQVIGDEGRDLMLHAGVALPDTGH